MISIVHVKQCSMNFLFSNRHCVPLCSKQKKNQKTKQRMSFVIRYKRSHTTSRKNKYKNRHTKITQIIVDVCLSNEKMSKLFRKNQKSCHINVIWREKLVQPTKQDYGDLPENKKIRLCASYEILTAELGIRIPYLQVWIPGLIWHRF